MDAAAKKEKAGPGAEVEGVATARESPSANAASKARTAASTRAVPFALATTAGSDAEAEVKARVETD